MKNKKSNYLIIIVSIIVISLITLNNKSRAADIVSHTPDFRNYYGISWSGTACDNLAYAKSMGYDYVAYQGGMKNCAASDKQDMRFYIGDPEAGVANTIYASSIDITSNYSTATINKYNSYFAWKGNGTNTAFPYNLATGWWFTNKTFRPNPDYQQQWIIDFTVNKAVTQLAGMEDPATNFRFGGWAWDVPDLVGDWWTERQAGYTGAPNLTCNSLPCRGKIVNLAYWNNGTDSSALHGNITHEYSTYTEARAALWKKLFVETRKLYPDMKLFYEPYTLYGWIKQVENRADKLELMPPNEVYLCQESGDNVGNMVNFVTDPRIYASGLITKNYTCIDTPDNHDIDDNVLMAGTAAINGAWMGWYGRTGGTDGTTNYAIRDLPYRLKLIRVVPNWDNINKVPISSRTWSASQLIYSSPNSYADINVIYSRHPDNGNLYAVVLNKNLGKINIAAGLKVDAIYNTDPLFRKSVRADSDFSISGTTLTLTNDAGLGNGYIIETSREVIVPQVNNTANTTTETKPVENTTQETKTTTDTTTTTTSTTTTQDTTTEQIVDHSDTGAHPGQGVTNEIFNSQVKDVSNDNTTTEDNSIPVMIVIIVVLFIMIKKKRRR
jgi:hypothetical protein